MIPLAALRVANPFVSKSELEVQNVIHFEGENKSKNNLTNHRLIVGVQSIKGHESYEDTVETRKSIFMVYGRYRQSVCVRPLYSTLTRPVD